jgi:membrane-bound lytic murein transglycosylase D
MGNSVLKKLLKFILAFMFLLLSGCAHMGQSEKNGQDRDQNGTSEKRELQGAAIPRGPFILIKSPMVDKELKRMTGPHKRSYKIYLERGLEYREMMLQIFKEYSIPQEMLAIPLVESGFQIIKRGPGGVSGLWCFVPSTAKRLGLLTREDRLSPEKQTRAAAKFLVGLYEEFGDWNWVLLAYNRGDFGMKKLKKRMKDKALDSSLFKNPHIPYAGKDYLAKIHASVELMKLNDFIK